MMRSVYHGKSSSSEAPLDCDVALGLKMQLQPTESHSGDGSGGGGGVSFFSYASNPVDNSVRSFHSTADFRASGGGSMPVSGKPVFTATQWQELERQQIIHKYMMTSVPVPPQLVFAPSLPPPVISQSNTSGLGLDLRFSSSGSDPEPWRCRRTDGKKWRCSRDVAPDQKYCDRHAHKSRPRSRKPVELSASHNTTNLQSFDQSRFIRAGSRNSAAAPVIAQQPWQQMQTPSLSSESKNKDNSERMYEDGQGVLRRFENAAFQTRYFMDDGLDGITNKFLPSSLTLSIPGGNGTDDQDIETASNLNIGVTTMNPTDRDSDGGLKVPPWMNPWVHPGGPLGEALCMGNTSVTGGGSDLASPHISKSNAFNFIG